MKYWDDEELKAVVQSATSGSEVLRYFGLPDNQGHYRQVLRASLGRLGLDTTHFKTGGNHPSNRLRSLKKRLIKEGVLQEACAICFLGPVWNNKRLVLHLDHINGDNKDNRLKNLRLLCPNCHSQTETYCGLNKRRAAQKRRRCPGCGKPKSPKAEHCQVCSPSRGRRLTPQPTKIVWPSRLDLLRLVQTTPMTKIAQSLGVSDKAVKKRCLKQRIPTTSRGGWQAKVGTDGSSWLPHPVP